MDINKLLNSKKLLTEIYFEIHNYYEKKYKNVVVLMEIGSFFEIYEANGVGKAREIASILNIQLTKKNKSIDIVDVKNPLMAGFPSQALDRYLDKLIDENRYTIVIIKQKGIPPNVKRYLHTIISPGVNLEAKDVENYLTSIVIEKVKDIYYVGYSNVDITTGKSYIFEGYSSKEDTTFALDEVFKFLHIYSSKEVILTLRGVDENEIVNYLELEDKNVVLNTTRVSINYQNELFKKVYNINSILTPIEVMNLERYPLITESLAVLLEFIISHSKDLVCNLKLPVIIESSKYIYLGNSPIKQLEIDKVLKLIDKTKTLMGKRLLKERLYNPIRDKEEILKRYEAVEFMLDKYKEFEELLKDVYDIERLHRKIELLKLNPFELKFLLISLRAASEIYLKVSKKSSDIDNFISKIEKNFYEDKLIYKLDDIKNSFFKEGIIEELDELTKKRDYYVKLFEKIKEKIESLGDIKVEIAKTEKEGFYFNITKSRFKLIKDKFLQTFIEIDGKKIFFKDFNIRTLTNSVKIRGEFIEEINEKLLFLEN